MRILKVFIDTLKLKRGTIKLDQQPKRIEIDKCEIDNEIVFSYFNNLPATERDEKFFKALYIGIMALMEDRFSTFLAKTTDELV